MGILVNYVPACDPGYDGGSDKEDDQRWIGECKEDDIVSLAIEKGRQRRKRTLKVSPGDVAIPAHRELIT